MMIIAKNKKALFDYEILENIEAGLVLQGCEIKSIRERNVNLKGSYVIIRQNEAWIKGMHISPFKFTTFAIDPLRERKLLLKSKEIERISKKLKEQGVACIPIGIGLSKRGFAKINIALAKGKKKFDKRESLKSKDLNRQILRKIKKFS